MNQLYADYLKNNLLFIPVYLKYKYTLIERLKRKSKSGSKGEEAVKVYVKQMIPSRF